MARLLILLDSSRRVHGHARLDEPHAKELKFTGVDALLAKLPAVEGLQLVIAGAHAESDAALALASAWPDQRTAPWYADDLAYLFGLSGPGNMAQLAEFAAECAKRLEDIDDGLLAQLAALAEQCGEGHRLGFLAAELHRRHDVLNVPGAGNVDLELFYPLKGEGGAPPRQEVAPDILERIFEAREALAAAFQNYEEREQQIEMARAVEQALIDSQPLVVEAGTGVGKSLAYLLPLAIHAAATGKLCLVSTNTINLQEQLIKLDIPRMRQILDTLELRVTLLKGREHYLCLKRLHDVWLINSQNARARRERHMQNGAPALLYLFRLLLDFADEPHGDLDVSPAAHGLKQGDRAQLQGSIDCGYHTCLGDRCEYKNHCHFFIRRAEAALSHITITNHALVFALHDPANEDADSVVTRASVIVFDEAHNLESAITNQHTLEVNDAAIVDLGNRLLELLQHPSCRHRLELLPSSYPEELQDSLARLSSAFGEIHNWIKLGAGIRGQINLLLEQASGKGHLELDSANQLTPSTATPGQAQVMELLARLAARLLVIVERFVETVQDLQSLFGVEESDLFIDDSLFQMDLIALRTDLLECNEALAQWHPDDAESITWFNADLASLEPRWEYKTAPLDVGPIFQSLLAGKDCLVLCSATLSVAGSFDFLQASLGFDPATVGRTRWLRLESPFDYANKALMLLATDMATPTGHSRHQYLEQLEEVVAGVCRVFPKGVLVLFNSYRDLQHIAARLPASVEPTRILVQGESGSRQEIATRFRAAGDKVLLATRSFWEGFDVSGEALSCVVLAKLPFANYKDPIHAGRQRAIEAQGGDSFRNYSLPLAAMQLKQGFGRLIRTTRDYGCVFLLDSRAARASYGKVFIDSLPGPRVVSGTYMTCLDAAAQFMQEQAGQAEAGNG